MAKFRFQDLRIWQEAIQLALMFFEIADELENKRLWRFADQCRGVGMSISNNISESTGSNMVGEQHQLLRYSKRECYEGANIIILLHLKSLISSELHEEMLDRLDLLSRGIQSYSYSIK